MQLAVYHQDCPKLAEVGGTPQLILDTTCEKDWAERDKVLKVFRTYKCGKCGMEVMEECIRRAEKEEDYDIISVIERMAGECDLPEAIDGQGDSKS